MENVPIWHYRAPNKEEYKVAIRDLRPVISCAMFADTFYGLGKKNKKLAIVVADISLAGSISKFREDFPEVYRRA